MKTQRVCCPIDERWLTTEHTESKNTKITINPCDGRVCLKVSMNTPDIEEYAAIDLVGKVMAYSKFEPFTYRGHVFYNKKTGLSEVILQTENKNTTPAIHINREKFVYRKGEQS